MWVSMESIPVANQLKQQKIAPDHIKQSTHVPPTWMSWMSPNGMKAPWSTSSVTSSARPPTYTVRFCAPAVVMTPGPHTGPSHWDVLIAGPFQIRMVLWNIEVNLWNKDAKRREIIRSKCDGGNSMIFSSSQEWMNECVVRRGLHPITSWHGMQTLVHHKSLRQVRPVRVNQYISCQQTCYRNSHYWASLKLYQLLSHADSTIFDV